MDLGKTGILSVDGPSNGNYIVWKEELSFSVCKIMRSAVVVFFLLFFFFCLFFFPFPMDFLQVSASACLQFLLCKVCFHLICFLSNPFAELGKGRTYVGIFSGKSRANVYFEKSRRRRTCFWNSRVNVLLPWEQIFSIRVDPFLKSFVNHLSKQVDTKVVRSPLYKSEKTWGRTDRNN